MRIKLETQLEGEAEQLERIAQTIDSIRAEIKAFVIYNDCYSWSERIYLNRPDPPVAWLAIYLPGPERGPEEIASLKKIVNLLGDIKRQLREGIQ